MSNKPVLKLMTILLLCLLIMASLEHSEASCAEQYNRCRQPIPRNDLTCQESNADALCHEVCLDYSDFSTPEDCCMAVGAVRGICCCGPHHISSTTASPSPGNGDDGRETVSPSQDGGDVVVGDDDVVPAPGDGAPNDNYAVAAPNREDCYETAWPNEGTPCDDLNCRGTCESHNSGSDYDTCIPSDPDYCCCIPICARFLVSIMTSGCNEAACLAACLLQGFLAQHVNKCLNDRCCCHQLRILAVSKFQNLSHE